MRFSVSESYVEVEEAFRVVDKEENCLQISPNIFDILEICSGCGIINIKMSSIPMGAHTAFKARDNMSGGRNERQQTSFDAFQPQTMSMKNEVQYNPAQYSGKLMHSIWGNYNRYSVHNIKSHIAYDKA